MIDKALPIDKTLTINSFTEAANSLNYLADLKIIGSQEVDILLDKAIDKVINRMNIVVK